jgi:site-specific DNA recombinase
LFDPQHERQDTGFISGAEFATRPAFLRLMTILKPRAPFQMLIMSEVSRLGREQIETAWALKQLSVAGVRCFAYLDGRELLMGSATDKFLLGAVTFAADLEREKARQRTYDALLRKAKAGHVTGGRVFGYDNVTVLDPSGKRSHVERVINPTEADVVRRIFQLRGEGMCQSRIAKHLNAERAVTPRSQQGRPRAWSPSSVHAVLFRDLYRGVIYVESEPQMQHLGPAAADRSPGWRMAPGVLAAPADRVGTPVARGAPTSRDGSGAV